MTRTEAAYELLDARERFSASDGYIINSFYFTGEELEKYRQLVNDGYILWLDGGECPVDGGTEVDVVWRDWTVKDGRRAGHQGAAVEFTHYGSPWDIIAYRVVGEHNQRTMLKTKSNVCSEREDVPECSKVADMVNNPPHYQILPGVEVYDIRCALMDKIQGATHAQVSDWDRAVEYLLRMWDKNGIQDAKKARWYLDKLIEKLEK